MDTITKAFEILDAFYENDTQFSISDISRITNISPSTAHRITTLLVKLGYIDQKQKRGKYSLSTQKLVFFSKLVKDRLKLRNLARPYLRDLSGTCDEAVAMSARHGDGAFTVDVIHSDRMLNIRTDTAPYDLYSTGVGKVLLAFLPEQMLRGYLGRVNIRPRTDKTVRTEEELLQELAKVRRDGVAFDDEEHELGVRMVAAPIRDGDGHVIASVGLMGPSLRITREKMIGYAPAVKACAGNISREMGYTP